MPSYNNPIHRPTKEAFPKAPRNKLRTRKNPPIDGDIRDWQHRTNSPIYRQKVKNATELVKNYRLLTTGNDYLNRSDKDSIHAMLDTLTFDASRRTKTDGGAREILADQTEDSSSNS